MKIIKRYVFNEVDLETMVEQEIEEAKRALLRAETGVEWAMSQVQYNRTRIERLESRQHEIKCLPKSFKDSN